MHSGPDTGGATDSPDHAAEQAVDDVMRSAVEHFKAQRFPQTLACCDEVIRVAPSLVAAHAYRGLALRRLGRPEQAAGAFSQATRLEPENPASHEQLGLCLSDLHQSESALQAFQRAVELDEGRLVAWVNIGNLEMWRQNLNASEAAYRRALALKPDIAICHQNLCWVLRRLARYDEAVEAGRQAVRLAPENIVPYNYLSFALLAADRCAEAIDVCDTSLRVDRRNTSALAYKPSALQRANRVDEGRALVDLDRFVLCDHVNNVSAVDDVAGFNTALADYVLTCPTRPHDDTQTVDLLAQPAGPVVALKSVIDDAVRHYLAKLPNDPGHPYLAAKPNAWVLDGWATLLSSMEVQEHHFHQHGWISGVYYLKVPEFIGQHENGNAGFIEFMRFPQFCESGSHSEFATFEPYEGMLILFPSYFYHRVVEFPPSERRISFAFNVTPA